MFGPEETDDRNYWKHYYSLNWLNQKAFSDLLTTKQDEVQLNNIITDRNRRLKGGAHKVKQAALEEFSQDINELSTLSKLN